MKKNNFGGWLYRVAANAAHNAVKQINNQRKHHLYLQREDEASSALPGNITEQKELEKFFRQAIHLLPPRQKEAFQLIKIDGMSYKEAAEYLGIGRETVKTHLQQAIRFLRSYLFKVAGNNGEFLLILLSLNFL